VRHHRKQDEMPPPLSRLPNPKAFESIALVLVGRDWKSKKIYKSLRAHDGPVVGCITHPLEASKVATCSWDGLIKYWD
jgi:hypothetical protein